MAKRVIIAPTQPAETNDIYWLDSTEKKVKVYENNVWQQPDITPSITLYNFGAKGDGVTDDSKAFQNGLEAAQWLGNTLVIPQGQYRISANAPFEITQNISLIGENASFVLDNNVDFLAPKASISLSGIRIAYSNVNYEETFISGEDASKRTDAQLLIIEIDKVIYYIRYSNPNGNRDTLLEEALNDLEQAIEGFKEKYGDTFSDQMQPLSDLINEQRQDFGNKLDKAFEGTQTALSQAIQKLVASINRNVLNYDACLDSFERKDYFSPVNDPKRFPCCPKTDDADTFPFKDITIDIKNCTFENCNSILKLDTQSVDNYFMGSTDCNPSKETNPRDILNCLPPLRLSNLNFISNTIINSINCININTAFENLTISENTFLGVYGAAISLGKNVKARQNLWKKAIITNNFMNNIKYQYQYLSTRAMILYGSSYVVQGNIIENVLGGNYNETWGIYTKARFCNIVGNTVAYLSNTGTYSPPSIKDTPSPFVNKFNNRVFSINIKGDTEYEKENIEGFNNIVSNNTVLQNGRGEGVRLYNTDILCSNNSITGAKYGITSSAGLKYRDLYVHGNKIDGYLPDGNEPDYSSFSPDIYSYGINLGFQCAENIEVINNTVEHCKRIIAVTINSGSGTETVNSSIKTLWVFNNRAYGLGQNFSAFGISLSTVKQGQINSIYLKNNFFTDLKNAIFLAKGFESKKLVIKDNESDNVTKAYEGNGFASSSLISDIV